MLVGGHVAIVSIFLVLDLSAEYSSRSVTGILIGPIHIFPSAVI